MLSRIVDIPPDREKPVDRVKPEKEEENNNQNLFPSDHRGTNNKHYSIRSCRVDEGIFHLHGYLYLKDIRLLKLL